MADPSELAAFGVINILEELSGGDLLKWDSIFRLPYEVVMTKKLYNVTRSAYEARYMQILKDREESKQMSRRAKYR
jgi:hypothetical protein